MVVDNILLTGQIAAALSAILALFGIIVKWGIVKPIKAYIDKMTYPIQPTANGGKSLPDLINAVHRVERKVENISKRVEKLEG